MSSLHAQRPAPDLEPTLWQLLARLLAGEPSPSRPGADRPRGSVDWVIVLVTLGLTIFGLVMVFSASAIEAVEATGSPTFYLERQAIAAVIGVVGMVLLARVPSHRLGRVGLALYVACLIGLVAVFIPGIGHKANGAWRWISIGSLRLQPSEFMKLALLLVVAERVNRMPGGMTDPRRGGLGIVALALPALVLVLLEPDFGTTAILAGTVGLVLLFGGVPLRWAGLLAGVGLAAAVPLVIQDPYRLGRVASWLDPWGNAENGGYQVIMGWVALHYGGLWGQGLGEAMSSMKWLPFAHTDFIAAVTGEELGFLRLGLLLGVYGVLLWRGTRVALRSRTYLGSLAAGAIVLILGVQTLFNLCVVLGLVPPKGLVLPFMSYGASALVAHLWCVGVLLSVSTEGEVPAAVEVGGGEGRGRLVPVEPTAGMARLGWLTRALASWRSAQ